MDFYSDSPVQVEMNRRERLRLLARAYGKEFVGNRKPGVTMDQKTAESWAKDYPEIWKEWQDENA